MSMIAGNWKMHCTEQEAIELAEQIKGSSTVEVVIAPPFTALHSVKQATIAKNIILAAQNMHYEEHGAYTGQISASMLKDFCTQVLIGHSEPRQMGETDELINKKMQTAVAQGLQPILCIGEKLEEREQGTTMNVVTTQLEKGLQGVSASRMIIAYEPVWAIGTGKVATPEQAQEVHATIRAWVNKQYPEAQCTLLYGGSAKPENAEALLKQPDIDGLLIGGASLKAQSFNGMIEIAERLQ